MKILHEAARPSRKGPADWFSGTVWLDAVVNSAPPSRFKATCVTFETSARTAWHTHPRGQALHVLSGVGLIQLHGEDIQLIHPGDAVWIEAGELHWHGATLDHTLVHLAMQEADDAGIDVVWLNHVTDAEYSARG